MERLDVGARLDDPMGPYLEAVRDSDRACWTLANMVGGLDGSAAVGGRVGALSEGADAELFRAMRTVADVVLVGAQTVRSERYGPVRLHPDRQASRVADGRPPNPPLAIVSGSLALDWASPAFTEATARTLVITSAAAPPDRVQQAKTVADVIIAGGQRVEPALALAALAERGHRLVLCEGGPTLLGELVADDLLDELCLTVSPLMGGDPLPISVAPAGAPLRSFRLAHVLVDDGTLFLRYTRGAP